MKHRKNCIEYCRQYVDKKNQELAPWLCEKLKMSEVIFSTFNHLSIYFPEAYNHMLKVWGLENENN